MKTPARTLVASAALLAVLTACGEENDTASEPEGGASSTTSDTGSESPTDTSSEGSSEGSSEAAGSDQVPAVVADGDVVTGLDFTDTAELGDELVVEVLTEGDGPAVESGQSISVNYYGALYGEQAPFDESYSGGQPVSFAIGVGQVIPGWDQALVGVPVGSRVIMAIPPALGYGTSGAGPIPPDSDLYFVVDILDAS